MTDFTLNSTLSQTKWSTDYLKSYVRKSGFSKDMKPANAPIIVNRDLSKNAGDLVRVPYFGNLTGAGVTGSTALKGSEEALSNNGIEIRVNTVRNGVLIHENDMYKTDLQLANIAAESLRDWSANVLRTDIVAAMTSVPVTVAGSPDSTVLYGSATTANLNAWNAANSDRLVFGTATTASTGVHATDLATIAGSEVLSAAVLGYAKDLAESTATCKINPYGTDDTEGREYYIFYTGTRGYNQLRNDADIKASMQYAWTRDEMRNPLFRGGDMLWNGIIIRKIPEIGVIGNVGTASASVAASFLCGMNAVGVAYSAMPEARKDVDDYGEKNGVAIREVRGTKKLTVGLKDIGQVTVYHSAA